jgi:hypothetical protein
MSVPSRCRIRITSTSVRSGEYKPTAKPSPTLSSPRPNSNVSFAKREYRLVIGAPESDVPVELPHQYAPEYCPLGRDARARSSSREFPWELGRRSPEDFGRFPVHPPTALERCKDPS